MRRLLTYIAAFFLVLAPVSVSATVLFPIGGGTGSTTLSGILIGNGLSPVRTLTIGTNLTLSGTTLNASGGGSGVPWMFGFLNDFATTTVSTTTSIYTVGAFFSSSTQASQFPYASSTALTAGNLFATNLTLTNPLPTVSGGTGLSNPGSPSVTALLQFAGSSGASALTPGAQGSVIVSGVSGATFTAGNVDLADFDAVGSTILPIANGGTNIASYASGDMLYANRPGALARIASTTSGTVLALLNGIPTWTATTTFSGLLSYANGNVTCPTCGTGSVTSIAAGTGLAGGTITTSGTLSLPTIVGTSTSETQGQLAVWGTTSGTPAKLYSIPTTTATCTGNASCSAFTVIGSSPITINATGGSGLTWMFGSLNNFATTTVSTTTSITTQGVYFSSSTAASSQFPYASTTAITATTASTTNLILSSAGGTGTRCVQVGADGTLSATASACGSGGSGAPWPFTPSTNFGNTINTQATSTALWLQAGLQASSTIYTQSINLEPSSYIFYGASTTFSSSSTIQSTFVGIGAGNFLGTATSTTIAPLTYGNTAIGFNALYIATSSPGNTAVGYGALWGGITAASGGIFSITGQNTAIGAWALASTTSGNINTAVGYQALSQLTTGVDNTAIGYQAMGSGVVTSSTGRNTAIGRLTLFRVTSGNTNTAVGYSVGSQVTTGTNNTFIGSSIASNSSGAATAANNTIMGASAGNGITASFGNTLLGYRAGFNLTTGADNIILGITNTTGGGNLTTGYNDILIGQNAATPAVSTNNYLNIGNLLFGTLPATTTNTVATQSATGTLGIATTTPWGIFSISQNAPYSPIPSFVVASSTQTATTTNFIITNGGGVGIATSTPWGLLTIGTSTTLFSVSSYGQIQVAASQPATTTSITLDWGKTTQQVEYWIDTSATKINVINATTSRYWGSTHRIWVYNPPANTAGALTWSGIEWIGTAPTQTTTAGQGDLYSCNVTRATSTAPTDTYKVACAASTGLQ